MGLIRIARLQRSLFLITSDLGRWPRAGSPAEHLGWGARLSHFAPLALRSTLGQEPDRDGGLSKIGAAMLSTPAEADATPAEAEATSAREAVTTAKEAAATAKEAAATAKEAAATAREGASFSLEGFVDSLEKIID